jgi:hypothetical protein
VLSDAHYEAIGRVAVNASELEHLVIMLLVLKRGNVGDETAMATQNNGKWRKELRQLAEEDATDQGKAVARWLDDVERLMDRRHELMHARWFRDGTSATRSPIGMRARRDKGSQLGRLKPVVVSRSAWLELADELEQTCRQVWPFVREEMRRCGLT